MGDLFLRAFLAHIISDVLLQPDFLSKKKKSAGKWIIFHGVITFASLLFFGQSSGWGVVSKKWILFSASTSISHYIIDLVRIRIGKRNIFISIIDQALHVVFIVLFLFIFFKLF